MSRPNPFQQTTQLLKSQQDPNWEHKLGLYQVFQRLYDKNPALLDEIIALEDSPPGQEKPVQTPYYIIGNYDAGDHDARGLASLTTNLLSDRTQTLHQPEQTWLVGRAPDSGLCLDDVRLSRYHAAIQFCQGVGFELVDLGSTNGSFVNGEAVRHRRRLQEGDRIRLGSLTIHFFEQPETIRVPQLPKPVLEQLCQIREAPAESRSLMLLEEEQSPSSSDETMVFLRGEFQDSGDDDMSTVENHEQSDRQSRLLERLKQIP